MDLKVKSETGYCALVKFWGAVVQSQTSFSFSFATGESATSVVSCIADEFRLWIDEASYLQDDPETSVDPLALKDLNRRLLTLGRSVRRCEDLFLTDDITDCICVGHSVYGFSVVAIGPEEEFCSCVLSALENDPDFTAFVERRRDDWEEESSDSAAHDERVLIRQFERLGSLDDQQLEEWKIMPFLRRVEDLVHGDMM